VIGRRNDLRANFVDLID